nr:propionyl-CoA carboxylase regulator-like [Nerophis lumbriciformis]
MTNSSSSPTYSKRLPIPSSRRTSCSRAYRTARDSASTLADNVTVDGETVAHVSMPSEETPPTCFGGFARLDNNDMYRGLVGYLDSVHGIEVRVEKEATMSGNVRRFVPVEHQLLLSEVLAPRSRNFQLAHQIGLLDSSDILNRIARDQMLTSPDSRALCRVALANYFAGAVLMPYQPFLDAARDLAYDIELLGHRFRSSFEQICHRLTTLRRPGHEGVPFHLVRIDVAGNISKRFTSSGFRFARFSGACPRWNEHQAFLTPGMVRVQLSQMPDGTAYFCVARTVRDNSGGFTAPHAIHAVGLGCEVRFAGALVYARGIDLENVQVAVPIGVACRVCERTDCEQRAFPPLLKPLRVDENRRGRSFYMNPRDDDP